MIRDPLDDDEGVTRRADTADVFMQPRLSLSAHFGFGGDLGSAINATNEEADSNMDTTFGAQLRMEFPLGRYLAVGGHLGFLSWIADHAEDSGEDRNRLLSFGPWIKGRYPFFIEQYHSEFYGGLMLGLNLSMLSNDGRNAIDPGRISAVGLGWNVGLMAGMQFFLYEELGLHLEFGWMRHAFAHRIDDYVVPGASIEWHFSQFVLQTGITALF